MHAATRSLGEAMRQAQAAAASTPTVAEVDEEELSDSSEDDYQPTSAAINRRAEKGLKRAKREAVAGRADNLAISIELVEVAKSEAERAFLLASLGKQPLFDAMDETQLSAFVGCMAPLELGAGETLIRQGDLGEEFYVVEAGKLDCSIEGSGVVRQYSRGESFGELALLYDCPRAATISATADGRCALWSIGLAEFKQITVHGAAEKRARVLANLGKVASLGALSAARLTSMADAMGSRRYEAGEAIITQGEEGQYFYILQEGRAVVTVDGREVAVKQANDCFGETALETDEPRNATITATDPCVCLRLSRADFVRLIGDLRTLGTEGDADTPRGAADRSLRDLEAADSIMTFFDEELALSDFRQGAQLGRGSFGKVVHAQHVGSGKWYALKCLSKSELVRNGQVPHLMNEKAVLQAIHHPNLVNLEGVFQVRRRSA